jgi:hypothetical protein
VRDWGRVGSALSRRVSYNDDVGGTGFGGRMGYGRRWDKKDRERMDECE